MRATRTDATGRLLRRYERAMSGNDPPVSGTGPVYHSGRGRASLTSRHDRPEGRVLDRLMDPVQEEIARVIRALDVEAVQAAYWRQNEFVYLERCLPSSVIEPVVAEVERVRPAVHRNYIPKHKKGGSVGSFTLAAEAPAILALYRSPAFIDFLRRVTGRPLQCCPDTDPHACALYITPSRAIISASTSTRLITTVPATRCW